MTVGLMPQMLMVFVYCSMIYCVPIILWCVSFLAFMLQGTNVPKQLSR